MSTSTALTMSGRARELPLKGTGLRRGLQGEREVFDALLEGLPQLQRAVDIRHERRIPPQQRVV